MTPLKAVLFTLCAALSLSGLARDIEFEPYVSPVRSTPSPSRLVHVSALAHDGHIMATPDTLEWQDGPPSLPEGAQVVVLEGNPAEEGPLTLRLKFPPGFQIAPHSHPALEHITVLEGTFHMGVGDELDRAKGSAFPTGSFVVMPVGTHHFAWTGDEGAVVQLHSTGPFDSVYVDPADDPRNQ